MLGIEQAMNWNFRTYLRLFLVLGGIVFFAFGVLDGEPLQVALGAVALAVGGGGLGYEWRQTATKD